MEVIRIGFESKSGFKATVTSEGRDSIQALENALYLVFDGFIPRLEAGDIITILPIDKDND